MGLRDRFNMGLPVRFPGYSNSFLRSIPLPDVLASMWVVVRTRRTPRTQANNVSIDDPGVSLDLFWTDWTKGGHDVSMIEKRMEKRKGGRKEEVRHGMT